VKGAEDMTGATNITKNDSLSPLLLCLACLGLLAWLFQPFAGKVVEFWTENPTYTHSPLIPFVIAYLIWDKRKTLAETEIVPSYRGGLPMLLISSLIWIVAVGGKSRFAVELTFVFLIISVVWLNFGSALTKKLSFPLFLLLMMVPIPTILYAAISRKLQLLSSTFGVAFIQLFSIPVHGEGNIIYLPETTLQVAEACSGISSLVSLFTLAMIYAYISQKGFLRRSLIVLSSFPIAVFMNWVRIAATGMIAHYWSLEYAQGFYHSFSGWIVFIVAFGIFLMVGSAISYFSKAMMSRS